MSAAPQKSYYPDSLSVRMPAGFRRRVEKLAVEAGMSPADWLRGIVRRAIESAERTDRRKREAKQ